MESDSEKWFQVDFLDWREIRGFVSQVGIISWVYLADAKGI